MLLVDPDAIAVVVSALFGGDPDLPASPIARDLSPTEIDRRRHGLQDGRRRRSTARASAPSTCAFRCRRQSPAPSLPSTSCATVRPCASTSRSSAGRSFGPAQPAHAAACLPQASRRYRRRQAGRPAGAGRLGRPVRRGGHALVGAARGDDAAVAADARRDRRLPRRARSSRSMRPRNRPRCCRRARRRCSSANSASSGRTTRFASSIRSTRRRNSSMDLLPG